MMMRTQKQSMLMSELPSQASLHYAATSPKPANKSKREDSVVQSPRKLRERERELELHSAMMNEESDDGDEDYAKLNELIWSPPKRWMS